MISSIKAIRNDFKKIVVDYFNTATKEKIFLVLSIWFVILLTKIFAKYFSYHRWDNFESLTPLVWETITQLLNGEIPFWTKHQHLGEPLIAMGIPTSLYYFPHIIMVAVLKILGLDASYYNITSALLHLPIFALGLFELFRYFKIRDWLGWAGSLLIVFAGGFTIIALKFLFKIE